MLWTIISVSQQQNVNLRSFKLYLIFNCIIVLIQNNYVFTAIGPFCDLNQDVGSFNHTEGAGVAIEMQEYERERDQCPMHFDDGSNPWMQTENYIKIFDYGFFRSSGTKSNIMFIPIISCISYFFKYVY